MKKSSSMPDKGGAPTGMFSCKGKQKVDPLGSGFKPQLTGSKLQLPRKGPVSRKS